MSEPAASSGGEITGLDGILTNLISEVKRLKTVEVSYRELLAEHGALKASYDSLANGSPAAKGDGDAAAGGATKWIKCYSPSDHSYYYYNTNTTHTQWELPDDGNEVEDDHYSTELAAADVQAEYGSQLHCASAEEVSQQQPALASEEEEGFDPGYSYAVRASSTNPYPLNPAFLSSMDEPSAPLAPMLVEASALTAIDASPLYLDSGVATATAVLIDEVLEEESSNRAGGGSGLLQRRRRARGCERGLSIRSEFDSDDDDDDDNDNDDDNNDDNGESVPGLIDTDAATADPRLLARLIDMGFAEASAKRALISTRNNISVAVADLVQSMSSGPSAAPSSGAATGSSPAASGGSSRRLLLSNGLSSIQSTSRRLFGRPKTAAPPAEPPANPYPRSSPASARSTPLNVYPSLRR